MRPGIVAFLQLQCIHSAPLPFNPATDELEFDEPFLYELDGLPDPPN
jgi:hypothetical protein